jgi:large subunit ribosomal protein L30
MKNKLKVTLMRSKFGRKPGHRECVEGLGLRKTYSSVVVEDNPCIRGMITKASYLLKVEEV